VLSYLILGITFAFAAAIQPGPLQSYYISQTLSKGWKYTMPAVFAPLVTDGPIIFAIVFLLSQVPIWFIHALQLIGGCFLFYLAFKAWRAWIQNKTDGDVGISSDQQSLKEAVIINFLSPSPYLGWSLVMGPLLIQGWTESSLNAIILLLSFYCTMIICSGGIILLFSSAKFLGPKVTHLLLGFSVIALAGFGLYQFWQGIKGVLL